MANKTNHQNKRITSQPHNDKVQERASYKLRNTNFKQIVTSQVTILYQAAARIKLGDKQKDLEE